MGSAKGLNGGGGQNQLKVSRSLILFINFRPDPQIVLFGPARPGLKLIYYKICTII